MSRKDSTSHAEVPYRLWSLGAAALLVLVLAAQVPDACSGPSVNEQMPDTDPGRDVEPANSPLEDPSEFYGTQRTVGGEVGEVLSPVVFVMVQDADDAEGRDPEGLLVVNTTERAPTPELSVGRAVLVAGRVEEFSLEEAERETGVDLDDEALAGHEGEPSIYATTIDADGANRRGETTR